MSMSHSAGQSIIMLSTSMSKSNITGAECAGCWRSESLVKRRLLGESERVTVVDPNDQVSNESRK